MKLLLVALICCTAVDRSQAATRRRHSNVHSPSHRRHGSDQRRQQHDWQRAVRKQQRVAGVMQQVLRTLQLDCIPQVPKSSTSSSAVELYQQALSSISVQSRPAPTAAQSLYASCTGSGAGTNTIGPGSGSGSALPDQDYLEIHFNLTQNSFLRDFKIDLAELRLFKLIPKTFESRDAASDEMRLRISVQVVIPPDNATADQVTRMLDSKMYPWQQGGWIRMDVSQTPQLLQAANHSSHVTYRILLEDADGRTRRTANYVETRTCGADADSVSMDIVPGVLLDAAAREGITIPMDHRFPILDLQSSSPPRRRSTQPAVLPPCPPRRRYRNI